MEPIDPSLNSFGRLIRTRRLDRGLTLRKFAEALNVSPTYVSGFENGTIAPPTPERLGRIAEILAMDYEELLTLAKRWEDAIPPELDENPRLLALYRTARTLDADQLERLRVEAERIKGNDEQ